MASSMEELEQVYGNGKVNFVVLDAEKAENAKYASSLCSLSLSLSLSLSPCPALNSSLLPPLSRSLSLSLLASSSSTP